MAAYAYATWWNRVHQSSAAAAVQQCTTVNPHSNPRFVTHRRQDGALTRTYAMHMPPGGLFTHTMKLWVYPSSTAAQTSDTHMRQDCACMLCKLSNIVQDSE